MLYLDKISGERLQDHWSSVYEHKPTNQIIENASHYETKPTKSPTHSAKTQLSHKGSTQSDQCILSLTQRVAKARGATKDDFS